jgi:hypothetical protein
VERLLAALVPPVLLSGRAGRHLLREIVALCILRPGLGALAHPHTLNLIFYNLLADYQPRPPQRRSNFSMRNARQA